MDLDTLFRRTGPGVLEVRAQLPEQSGSSATKVQVSRGGGQPPEAPENDMT